MTRLIIVLFACLLLLGAVNAGVERVSRLVSRFGISDDVAVTHAGDFTLDALQGYYSMTLVSCRPASLEALLENSKIPLSSTTEINHLIAYRNAPTWCSPEKILEITRSGSYRSAHVEVGEIRFAILIDFRDSALTYVYFEESGG